MDGSQTPRAAIVSMAKQGTDEQAGQSFHGTRKGARTGDRA
jgi:hypothetical protein